MLQNVLDCIGLGEAVFTRKFTTTSHVGARIGKGKRDTLTKENTKLTEVITIYEKLTKSKDRGDADVFHFQKETNLSPSSSVPVG